MRETGPRARTRRLLLETAMQLMQAGARAVGHRRRRGGRGVARHGLPLLPDPGGAGAGGGRRGARADPRLALGPAGRRGRGSTGCSTSPIRGIDEYEATLRAALLQAMDQWSRRRAGTLGRRGADRARQPQGELLDNALAPLRGQMAARGVRPAARSRCRWSSAPRPSWCSRTSGASTASEARDVALWSAHALVRAAVAEAADGREGAGGRQAGLEQRVTKQDEHRGRREARRAQGVTQGGMK